jgi:YegS/Rv2252/BmrU family lipid kinase
MNVWARELGLPLQVRSAAQAILSWQPRLIDLGKAEDRYFLLMAGIGFDAAITAAINPGVKRRFGALAYVWRGIEVALSIRGSRARLILDGRTVKGRVLLVVVGNTQLYGGLVKITHRASIDDGLLDVCVIKGDSFIAALRHTVAILRRSYSHNPEIDYYRARSIKVVAAPRLPVQVDGDPIGQTPLSLEVVPGALYALLPPEVPGDLVQQPATSRSPRSLQTLVGRLLRR